MPENVSIQHRQQHLYWNQMVELRVAVCYIRLYRDRLGRWVSTVGTIRAIASSTSIALWAVWQKYPLVWASVIAASQVLDALKEVFPVTKRYKAASQLSITMDSLFIDTQLEWENVFSGSYTDSQTNARIHKLRKLQHEAECRNFPEGLKKDDAFFEQAQSEARSFFAAAYDVQSGMGG